MSTTFISVQCFQCFTMQVKQAKTSSNKWVCVVCNQKQSVRRVFAEGLMAKNIRQFVQKFNMSRQMSDQKELVLEEGNGIFEMEQMEDKKKKRTDWTEYDQDECCGRFEIYDRSKGADYGDNTFDEAVDVTEMPKPVLKKPKLKDYAAGVGVDKDLLKPVFPNRIKAKRQKNAQYQDTQQNQDICSAEEEQIELHQENLTSRRNSFMVQILDDDNHSANMEKPWLHRSKNRTDVSTSKWNDFITLGELENTSKGTRPNHRIAANGPVSKWSSYITKEDDTLQIRGSGDSSEQITSHSMSGAFQETDE